MKATQVKGGAHPRVPAEDKADAVDPGGLPGASKPAGKGRVDSAADTGEVTQGSEAGYGAETHPPGEDFSHRKPWRRDIDAHSGRTPANPQSPEPPATSSEDKP